MYGLMHLSIMEMVKAIFGQATWSQVLETSEVDEDEDFQRYRYYPDSDAFNLLHCVAQTVSLPYNTILQIFGDYSIEYFAQCGYRSFLSSVGVDFVTFMQNMDSVHSLTTYAFSGSKMPSFSLWVVCRPRVCMMLFCVWEKDHLWFLCSEQEDGTITIHYYSERNSLVPMVAGQLQAVARELFHQTALVKVVGGIGVEEVVAPRRTIYHAVLEVQLMDRGGEKRRVDWAMGDVQQYWNTRRKSCLASAPTQDHPGTETVLRVEDFSVAFPYHMVLDSSLCLRQCGEDIIKLSQADIQQGTPFTEVGVIVQPLIYHTMENIRRFINSVFFISIYRKAGEKPLTLKGQMILLSHSKHLLFMGSPRFKSFEDLEESHLFLADIPLYDVSRELLWFIHQRTAEIEVIKKRDEIRVVLNKMSKILEVEKRKSEDLLYEMMPKKIALQLKGGHIVLGEIYKTCTVLFSDIMSFTEIASTCSAVDVIHMLNEMYYRFDMHTDEHKVYKVKTIGDAYMAVTGVPEVQEDHAECMADFAMDMIEESANVLSPATGLPVMIRVGMHSGGIVAGVIGLKKPRYDIYGNTVNTASRMERYSVPGRIHVSSATLSRLYPLGYKFLVREQIHVKVEGDMNTFFLVGYLNRNIPQPKDKYENLPMIFNPYPTNKKKKERGLFRAVGPFVNKLPVVNAQQSSRQLTRSMTSSLRSRILKLGFAFSSLSQSSVGSKGSGFTGHRRLVSSNKIVPLVPAAAEQAVKESVTPGTDGGLHITSMSSLVRHWSARITPQTSNKGSAAAVGAPVTVVSSAESFSSDDTIFSPYFGKHTEDKVEEERRRCRKTCSCVLL